MKKLACILLLLAFPVPCLAFNEPPTDAILDEAAKSVIRIHVEGVKKSDGTPYEDVGAGFVVTGSGSVLTAGHVIPEEQDVTIAAITATRSDGSGKPFPLQMVKRDSGLDIALLKIADPDIYIRPIPIAWTSTSGFQEDYAFGFPGGSDHLHRTHVTLQFEEGSRIRFEGITNQGHSGGPIVDSVGRVVGMVSARVNGSTAVPLTGINKAVSSASFLVPDDYNVNDIFDFFVMRGGEGGEAAGYELSEITELKSEIAALSFRSNCKLGLPAQWIVKHTSDGYTASPPADSGFGSRNFTYEVTSRLETTDELRKRVAEEDPYGGALLPNQSYSRIKSVRTYEDGVVELMEKGVFSRDIDLNYQTVHLTLYTWSDTYGTEPDPVVEHTCSSGYTMPSDIFAELCTRLIEVSSNTETNLDATCDSTN